MAACGRLRSRLGTASLDAVLILDMAGVPQAGDNADNEHRQHRPDQGYQPHELHALTVLLPT